MEVLDYETGDLVVREMLIQSEIQSMQPFNWGSKEGRPADIDWFIFHSAELPIGPTEEPVDWDADGVIVLPQLDVGGPPRNYSGRRHPIGLR